MIGPPPGVRVWLAAGPTDMRRGFDGLARLVQEVLGRDPLCVFDALALGDIDQRAGYAVDAAITLHHGLATANPPARIEAARQSTFDLEGWHWLTAGQGIATLRLN